MASHSILSSERERQLVEQVLRGDRGALGELLGAYHKRVYHVILRMVSNTEDAAELTQEVLLRAIKHADNFKGDSKFSTWLLRIAMNLAISHLRRTKVRKTVSLEHEVAGQAGADQATPLKNLIAQQREQTADYRVETQEQIQRLGLALEALEPSLRSVILLRDLQGMDYQQIAEVLAVPLGTVKSRLFRARLALRAQLNGSLSAESQDDHER
ncbi:sigma-70 family RNA polymerase sigma factor [Planctomycetales bacterium ZRK34]|nr:sigma-70 family RNA polymerase sigma factor [Planctomycetales bacterium ZRK34]